MNRALHGSCHVPVAAFAQLRWRSTCIWRTGRLGRTTAASCARTRRDAAMPEGLGLEVAEQLLAQGARALIDASDAVVATRSVRSARAQ